MRSLGLAASFFLLCLSVAGCADDRPRNPGGGGSCGDGARSGAEVCDGTDLGGQSCAGLGLGDGLLTCNSACMLDTTGCERSCTPDCSARECGLDPACPTVACGSCGTGSCTAAGICSGGDPSAPRILSLSTNVTTLGPGTSLVITAVVTDPDGIADLIGGQLEAPTGGTYGAFVTSGGEGSFSITLSLSDLDAVEAIAAPPSGADRTLRARFFDSAGLEASRDLTVRLTCDDGVSGLCGHICQDLGTSYDHCGSCNASCEGSGADICRAGRCASLLFDEAGGAASCTALCSTNGLRCDDGTVLTADDDSEPDCVGFPGCGYADTGVMGISCSTPIAAPIYGALCLCSAI
ncbi:MAG: hypothetical protein KC619_35935 [Myxococcales bacterium]|nr:hypothetical protein [Myxococcales bacterium]